MVSAESMAWAAQVMSMSYKKKPLTDVLPLVLRQRYPEEKTCPKPCNLVQTDKTNIQAHRTCFLCQSLFILYFINLQRNKEANPIGLTSI